MNLKKQYSGKERAMSREERYLTRSGIEIFGYGNPASASFYISLFLRAGSMYESEKDSGITHFLEHVAIRNVNALMDGGLYPLLDKYGIEFNASTYSEMVQFYVSGAKRHFDVGARIISLILSPIVLSADDIRTECARIKAEIRENDEKTSLAAFTSAIVHEGTTLSRPITGTVGGVGKITKARLEEYRLRVFTKDNLFLYVTGAYQEGDIELLSRELDRFPLGEGEAHRNIAPVPETFGRRERAVHIKNADFTMARFTFDLDMTRLSVAETDLLYDILLSGYNSKFFIEMSEKRGLFYDINGATERYKNIGSFTFSYEVRSDALYEAIETTFSVLEELKTELLPDDACMKAGYVDNALMLYDDARELNFTFAYDNHIMDNGYASLDERAARYREVTPERLRNAAREIFAAKNLTLTIKGNKRKIDVGRILEIIDVFSKNAN